jgi:hypothetical protein
MNTQPPRPTLIDTASDWTLFRVALGEACLVSEKEFRRLAMPERLRHLVAKAGADEIVAEINSTLDRLRVSYKFGHGGLDCAIQHNWLGITLGWLVDPYDDPVFRTIDPCRVLPSLVRLEKRIEANPDSFYFDERCKQVRRIISRTNAQS